jgi:putative mycofactocin binding protein MftB
VPRYALHPDVGLRQERFGALAYHYGNRRLTFVNDAALLAVVRSLDGHTDAEAALAAAGIPADRTGAYLQALERLHESGVLTCG